MQKKLLILLLTVFSFTSEELASTKNKEKSHLLRLQERYEKIQAMEANFIQENYQNTLAIKKSSKGKFFLQKPQKIRWETRYPNVSILVSDGYKVWYYSPKAGLKKSGQAILQPIAKIRKHPFFALLNGSQSIRKKFHLKKGEENSLGFHLLLAPIAKNDGMKEIEIQTNKNYLIQSLTLFYQNGNKTRILLRDIQLDPKLQLGLFRFKPPTGVKIIKE